MFLRLVGECLRRVHHNLLNGAAVFAEFLLQEQAHHEHPAGKSFGGIPTWEKVCSRRGLCVCVSVCASGVRSSAPCIPVPPPALCMGTDTTVRLTAFRLTS